MNVYIVREWGGEMQSRIVRVALSERRATEAATQRMSELSIRPHDSGERGDWMPLSNPEDHGWGSESKRVWAYTLNGRSTGEYVSVEEYAVLPE